MKYLLLLSLFLSSQSWAIVTAGSLSYEPVIKPVVVLPSPVGTPPPSNIEVWNDDWILETPLEGDLNANLNSTKITNGTVGLLCNQNYHVHDLWIPQVMQIADSTEFALFTKPIGSEDHMELLQRMFARIDRSIPSFSAKLRRALDQISINYVAGPLSTEGLNQMFKSAIPKCKSVRFSHRMSYTYGTEIYIDESAFYSPNMSVTSRAAVILHELIAVLFDVEMKSDLQIAYSGIVAAILASDFNYKSLFERIATFGFTLSDTYPYKAIAQYRAKLFKEKSSMLGIMLMNKETHLIDILELTQEYARELKEQFTTVQTRQYSDSYALDNYMNFKSFSITDMFNALKDLTSVMDRLFLAHENEILSAKKAIQELRLSKDVYAIEQIKRFEGKIEDINLMMKDQSKLKSKFDSVKRLNMAFIDEINSSMLDRLTRIHRFEQEELKKLPDMEPQILKTILEKRDGIYQEIISDLK